MAECLLNFAENLKTMSKNFENVEFSDYEKNYSDESFWKKIRSVAVKAGKEVIFTALKLYYVAMADTTPLWAKSIIYGALGYLILPVDLIADIVPVIGYVDDLAVMGAALGTVECFLNEDITDQSRKKLSEWFGENVDEFDTDFEDDDEEFD